MKKRYSIYPFSSEVFAVALMLAALGVIFRRLLAGRVLAGGDLHTYFFPYWMAAARALRGGELPLWNPHLFAGAPLLANSQAGVFYPLNWPLWALTGDSLAWGARTLHWSVLLHLALAAFNAYALGRRLPLTPIVAALSGLLYAGSGFLGVHVEHLNQLQGLAWLPLVLLPATPHASRAPTALNVLAFAMILLSGHTQTALIAAVALLVWRVAARGYVAFVVPEDEAGAVQGSSFLCRAGRALSLVARDLVPFALAGLIAAAQLLPTLALARYSVRSGGLPWREAVSFSVRPWELPRALLPPYLLPPLLPEGVAYLGLLGLVLAAVGAWNARCLVTLCALALLLLAGTGVFLALGGYNPLYLLAVRAGVPGLAHVRAPARFLALTVLAGSLLAGYGLEWLRSKGSGVPMDRFGLRGLRASFALYNWMPVLALALVLAELAVAAGHLPHAAATAPRAYTDLRPATAHLVAAMREDAIPPARFLSISKTLFDAGDEAEIAAVYGDSLSPEALWAYQVAAKQREVLAPNLSLAFGVPAADGYDGGLLPLRHYVDFSRLLLPEGTLDGRLRENLSAVPEARWLDLLGVRYLVTDKTGDAWVEDVFYDRQFRPRLAPGAALAVGWLPPAFEADALALLYSGAGAVEVTLAGDEARRLPLPARGGAATVPWERAAPVRSLALRASEPGLTLTGASLLDTRTGAFYPLVLSERFRLAHSGDVKVYAARRPPPRAFVVHRATCAASEAEALAALRDPALDPFAEAVVSSCAGLALAAPPEPAVVTPRSYTAQRVELDVRTAAPGLLVLTDAWYPGWRAEIRALEGAGGDPHPAEVLRADVLFRAVPLEAGAWRVTLTYRPAVVPVGLAFSALGVVGLGLYARHRRRYDIAALSF